MHIKLSNKYIFFVLLFTFLWYSTYLYSSLPIKNYSTTTAANAGKLAWQKYNCNACHQVYGLGGYLGPDLTNVYSAKGPQYIQAFLKTGTVIMPNFQLSNQEMNEIIAYLKNIDASGKADPKNFTKNYNGTIK